MGRKIPGRKHKGVKDPEKQQQERLNKIKDKINAPPSNPDDQQIPKSLARVIELKNKVKEGYFTKKKQRELKKQKEDKQKNKKYNTPHPKFQQLPGETDKQFLYRVNRICMTLTKEAQFEDKYRVDITRDDQGEVIDVVKRPKDELEVLIKKARKEENKKGKKKAKKSADEPRLTKSQKWQIKKAEKKKKKQEGKEDFITKTTDHVEFGEVVHAPPSLVTPKRHTVSKSSTNSLLLSSMFKNPKKEISQTMAITSKITKVIDKKGKRKELPNALRRQLDQQQKEVIDAYKILKSKNRSAINV